MARGGEVALFYKDQQSMIHHSDFLSLFFHEHRGQKNGVKCYSFTLQLVEPPQFCSRNKVKGNHKF